MTPRTLVLVHAAAALLALAVVPGAARAQAAAGGGAPDAEATQCDPLLARVLPGDFNFCLALKRWDQGRRAQAIELMRLAAGWGNKGAQTALGVAYFNGDGVAQDRALGLAWLALASERKAPRASGLYRSARSKVDDAEYARSDVLYRRMLGTYGDDVAALRAERRFRRQLQLMSGNQAYGVGICIAGSSGSGFSDANNPDDFRSTKPCSMASEHRVTEALKDRYEIYSAGWKGRVRVGPVKPVKARSGK